MRRGIIVPLAAVLVATGCSGGDGPVQSEDVEAPPVRGEIEVSVEPMSLDQLPAVPEAGTGVAVLGEKTHDFAVTFCDDASPIGMGQGDGVEVNWDIREADGDHRVSVKTSQDDGNWVRGGPAEAEWDAEARVVRFAGAFVPFRAEDGSEAVAGGVVLACPAKAAA